MVHCFGTFLSKGLSRLGEDRNIGIVVAGYTVVEFADVQLVVEVELEWVLELEVELGVEWHALW